MEIKNDFLTVVKGKKYDLRSFENNHPGGADLLRLAYGNDATELIYSYHSNPEKIMNKLTKFQVSGYSVESQTQNYFEIETKFFKELKYKVNRYFKLTKKNKRSGLFFRSLLLLMITVASYFLVLLGFYAISPLFGICLACLGLCMHHDANHGSYSNSAKINHYIGLMGDLIGSSSLVWRYQHCLGHHVYCNHIGYDPDVSVGLPWFRLHPKQPYYRCMKYQQYYTFLLYAMIGAVAPFWSIYEFLTCRHAHIQLKVIRRRDMIEFWIIKLIYFTYMVFIPYYALGFSMLWQFYLPAQLIGGLYLGTLFALNHNNNKVFSAAACSSEIKDWAMLQIINSANWSSQSKFWNIISGGLNCQIEHHLFPGISHVHYPALHRLVKKTCKKFAVPYQNYSFKEILIDHFLFLKKLGTKLS